MTRRQSSSTSGYCYFRAAHRLSADLLISECHFKEPSTRLEAYSLLSRSRRGSRRARNQMNGPHHGTIATYLRSRNGRLPRGPNIAFLEVSPAEVRDNGNSVTATQLGKHLDRSR